MPSDLRTRAVVMRRTNYGETDRILNLLTPEGKIAVIARGVRKEKSRLAGGIELFSISDVVIHRGKSDLGILTSARMQKFYANILGDFRRLELAGDLLKKLDRVAEQVDNPELFDLLTQALDGLNRNLSPELVRGWFNLNLARACGEEVNLYADATGEKLVENSTYTWNHHEKALETTPNGPIGAKEIKLIRVILVSRLLTVSHIDGLGDFLPKITPVFQTFC